MKNSPLNKINKPEVKEKLEHLDNLNSCKLLYKLRRKYLEATFEV